MNGREKILGIDYGDKRLGLALAEADSIAVPFRMLANQGQDELLEDLKKIIEQEKIDIVVVGVPHSLTGHKSDREKITWQFINYLKKNLDLPIETVDEQMTTKMYDKMGVDKDIDKYAATAILDTFLAQRNG